MANTTNLNLTKLTGTEKQKSFPSPYNDNMDAIDGAFGADFGVSGKPSVNAELNSLGDGLAIIANGNTHAAITSGQFVYVRGHGTLADGLYVATSNISANATLSGSNLTADTAGGLNTVYSSLNSNASLDISSKTAYTGDVHSASAGYHRCTSAATNIPTAENGYLAVIFRADNTRLLQYTTDSNKMYTQTLRNGTWGNWQELATIKTFSDTVQVTTANYRDTTIYDAVGKQMLAVYLDDNQWFAGQFGFDSSTGHICVRFIDVGSGNAKTLNDASHKYTFVYA